MTTYFLNTNFKVSSIYVKNFSFVRVLKDNYEELKKIRPDLPEYSFFKDKKYWINIKNTFIKVFVESKKTEYFYKLEYFIHHGYLTDFASVPPIINKLIEKDSEDIIVPSIIHDINYGRKFFTWHDSNVLFREMLKFNGMGLIKRWLIYKAVETPIAEEHYGYETLNKNIPITLKVSME